MPAEAFHEGGELTREMNRLERLHRDDELDVSDSAKSERLSQAGSEPSEKVVKEVSRVTSTGGITNIRIRKSKRQEKFEQELSAKTHAQFNEDLVSLAVVSYLKENIDHLYLVPAKRAQIFWAALSAQFMVLVMLLCMYQALLMNEHGDYTPIVSGNFWLFLVKFPTMYALHFLLTPEVTNGMAIMKYANQ